MPATETAPQQASQTSEPEAMVGVALVDFLSLLLSVLSQRAILALSHLLPIIALASGFFLWWQVLPDPSDRQLIGVGLYAAFMLALLVVRR